MLANDLKQKILKTIKPSPLEHKRRLEIVNELILILNNSNKNFDIEFKLGGSFGKGTYLKDTSDVDLFCIFNNCVEDLISDNLKYVLDLSGIDYQTQKGSRDYYLINFKGLEFDILPVFKVLDPSLAKTSTDHSIYHVNFVLESAKKNPLILDEIRITKQFFKAQGLYGAESYINGFSGHVLDLLTIYYGSFENLFYQIANVWAEEIVIDSRNLILSKEKIKENLENIDKVSKLIVLDPIVRNRNAARAISDKMYYTAIYKFSNLESLSMNNFIVNKFSIKDFKDKQLRLSKKIDSKLLFYDLELESSLESKDIVGTKCLKVFEKLILEIKKKGIDIVFKDIYINVSLNVASFAIFVKSYDNLRLKKIKGPNVYLKDAVKNFVKDKEMLLVDEESLFGYIYTKKLTFNQIFNYSKNDLINLYGRNFKSLKKITIEKF